MGEDPEELVKPARVQMILKTIYENNRVTNSWATQRTADGKEVKSDQGEDANGPNRRAGQTGHRT